MAAKAIYIIDYGNYGAVIHEYQAVIYDTLYLKKKFNSERKRIYIFQNKRHIKYIFTVKSFLNIVSKKNGACMF